MPTKSRADLKRYFVKNATPTEDHFADLIDSTINKLDDGLSKEAGAPLRVAGSLDVDNDLVVAGKVNGLKIMSGPESAFQSNKAAGICNDTSELGTLLIVGSKAQDGKIRQVTIRDRLYISGLVETSLVKTSLVKTDEGLELTGHRNSHIETNGAFYVHKRQSAGSTTQQVYITVDDSLCIRQKEGAVRFQFDTETGVIVQEAWRPVTDEMLGPEWKNSGGTFNPAGFHKDSMGRVHLRGGLSSNTNHGPVSLIFTLPPDCRPKYQELHVGAASPEPIVHVHVVPNGNVVTIDSNCHWLSLDGISFRAAQ